MNSGCHRRLALINRTRFLFRGNYGKYAAGFILHTAAGFYCPAACFEGAGLPPVNSTVFFGLVAGAISIYMLDLFLFYIIFRTMAQIGIGLTDKTRSPALDP